MKNEIKWWKNGYTILRTPLEVSGPMKGNYLLLCWTVLSSLFIFLFVFAASSTFRKTWSTTRKLSSSNTCTEKVIYVFLSNLLAETAILHFVIFFLWKIRRVAGRSRSLPFSFSIQSLFKNLLFAVLFWFFNRHNLLVMHKLFIIYVSNFLTPNGSSSSSFCWWGPFWLPRCSCEASSTDFDFDFDFWFSIHDAHIIFRSWLSCEMLPLSSLVKLNRSEDSFCFFSFISFLFANNKIYDAQNIIVNWVEPVRQGREISFSSRVGTFQNRYFQTSNSTVWGFFDV